MTHFVYNLMRFCTFETFYSQLEKPCDTINGATIDVTDEYMQEEDYVKSNTVACPIDCSCKLTPIRNLAAPHNCQVFDCHELLGA